jgi:hypothetical protein
MMAWLRDENVFLVISCRSIKALDHSFIAQQNKVKILYIMNKFMIQFNVHCTEHVHGNGALISENSIMFSALQWNHVF